MDMNDLPDRVRNEIGGEGASESEQLQRLGQALADKRREAVDARKSSGIEDVWRKAEEAYLGIDDANRHEFAGAKWAKPTALEGPVQTNANKSTMQEGARSTVFVRLTSRYVDAGAAKLGEILLPIDDKAFSLKATPVPDLINAQGDATQVMNSAGQPAERDPMPHEVPPGMNPQQAPGVPLTVADLAGEQVRKADASAKKAEKRIYDWMVESRYPMQTRKVIFDAARVGTGVLKSPFPDEQRAQAVRRVGSGIELKIISKIQPTTRWVDVWNIYPDPGCGENIQDGDYIFECDGISERSLRKLKRLPGYLADQIDAVIEEGPDRCNMDESGKPLSDKPNKRHQYRIWYFHGTLKRADMIAARVEGAETAPELVYAVATMVNDRVIRCTFNPLEQSGRHPYHAVPWQRRPGSWAGVGIGEQVNMPQRTVNAATRSMLNNAGICAGGQIVVDRGCIQPLDGNWTIYPNKLWEKSADATVDDVRKAFAVFEFPNVTAQLMQIIEYGFRLAEECTNIPLISQGQSGPSTPDTYGAAQLQNNNANQLLRNVGYQFDDYITEPVVQMHYEWLLLDPEVPEDEKGDWEINAHGSIALVERAIQDQTILQLGAMVMNPAFGMSPPRWFEQMLRSKRLDPRDFEMTDEEKQRQASQPPPKAPAVQAAEIRAASAEKIAAGSQAVQAERTKADTDRDAVYVQAETDRTEKEHAARMEELRLKRDLAMLAEAARQNTTLAQIKADLATDAAKIDLQRELATMDAHAKQVANPPVEPAGRASPGQAFQE